MRVSHRGAGILASVQDSAYDDRRVVGLVIVQNVLLDPEDAATGEEVVPRLANPRMS